MVEKEIENEREGNKKKGQGYLSQRNKGLPLEKGETDVAHRQLAVYKGKRGNPVLG